MGVVGLELFTDDPLGHSMLAEIQRKLIEKSERGAISRILHAKDDKGMIAAWRSDLSRILLNFTVGPLVIVRLLLTFHSQTELMLNSQTMIHDIHRITMKHQEGADDRDALVCIAYILFTG